jgi:hypothetical protein
MTAECKDVPDAQVAAAAAAAAQIQKNQERELVPQAVVCLETKITVIIFWRSEDILKRSPQDQGIFAITLFNKQTPDG